MDRGQDHGVSYSAVFLPTLFFFKAKLAMFFGFGGAGDPTVLYEALDLSTGPLLLNMC